jgi:hypothetical protein
VALLEQIHALTGKFDLVFAGDAKPWKPMSENTVNTRYGRWDTTPKPISADMGFVRWPAAH